MPRPWLVGSVAAWAAVCLVAPLGAQTRAGGEFQVNTFTTGYQGSPSVASDASGNFVVVWNSSGQDGSSSGVFGQRFSPAGTPLGAEFRVNTYTTYAQVRPHVASDAAGNFVVVWQSYRQDGFGNGIFGRRFNAAGAPVGAEFGVTTFTTGHEEGPLVAADRNGGFVVAWTSFSTVRDDRDVHAQRFSSAGTPLGTEFRVNTYTTNYQYVEAVATDADGDFVVVWSNNRSELHNNTDVVGQRYSAAGAPLGPEFQVNTFTTGSQRYASVASDADGNFVVVWDSFQITFGGYAIGDAFGQRFSAAGERLGGEFQVNTTGASPLHPRVSSSAEGPFVVIWVGSDGTDGGVFGQRFSAGGTPLGSEFLVNTYTTLHQHFPSIAMDASGNFVVAWTSQGQDGSIAGVFGQRFGGLFPSTLQVDPAAAAASDGNGVLEPGESQVVLRPSWRNLSGASHYLGSSLSELAGPPGGVPTVIDGFGLYGWIEDGAEAPCSDCFTMAVTAAAPRPAFHWDASVLETISPAAQGQGKRWRLHLGDSFGDVPRSNGFYRRIETLLHRGVTDGCGVSGDRLLYCPAQSSTREQMAKFVLVSKEGPAHLPQPCHPADMRTFADVPASNGFCPFVEELFRRGIVNGCAVNPLRYCPSAMVTREQMAKFVLKALDPALQPPDCVSGSEVFADVPASNGFCPFVEELFRRQVVNGCTANPPQYCPTGLVTREQMSKFLGLTFGLQLYGP